MFNATGVKRAARTFAVDEVVPETTPIFTEPFADHVAKRFRRKILAISEPQKPVINAVLGRFAARIGMPKAPNVPPEWLAAAYQKQQQNMVSRTHGLIDAVSQAYAEHRPLVLTPDCFWLTIEQGFAHHVAENAETLRPRLVRHHGKQELAAAIQDLSLASVKSAIANFSAQIRDHTDPVLHETLVCNFSTTTPTIRTASEVVLMDAYSSYFEYAMRFVCGIPKITVTGSLEDWQRIQSRIEVLATFGLEWWTARLRPILDELVRTASGEPNVEFWQAIYKPKWAYGDSIVTGWIADLFPYLGDAPGRRRNHLLECEREKWAIAVERGVGHGVFPSGLASVPVQVSFPNEAKLELDLVAGFMGVEQNPDDLALTPVVSWCLTERAPSTPIVV